MDIRDEEKIQKENLDFNYQDKTKDENFLNSVIHNKDKENQTGNSNMTINSDKVRKYLKNYDDLDNLIEFRKQQILKEGKTPTKILEITTDYKIKEMEFYRDNLKLILAYMKDYVFLGYQFIALKYFLKLPKQSLLKVVNTENLENMDNIIIDYVVTKLIEEDRKECQT